MGLLGFEAYRVIGEDALIIHEVFEDTRALEFHVTKGTGERYEKDTDEITEPDRYFLRRPEVRGLGPTRGMQRPSMATGLHC
jgi:quinol monooxygenase YgiN